ncbi:hypothetical protein SADUNF_Sadunf08G0102200 [Salix dunnii]|uniref:RING-type domain-containing protein n=1 Tax=Salix dunnii TaxID=1413687 RepID=A0A835JZZ1_9ROSI|nr:hypothetical protein SADUNF_Sadunf08G0102200 [Salix dunnii]
MGLQNQLNDVSSESILLLLIAFIANCVACLRSFLFSVFHSVGVHRFDQSHVVDDRLMGSGLAGLIVLAEQRKLNRVFAYNYCCDRDDRNDKGGSDCVVCLCTLRDGDQVRKLDCRHVFHKECFDGWLGHLNFNCPLCRWPLVSDERVEETRRRVGENLAGYNGSDTDLDNDDKKTGLYIIPDKSTQQQKDSVESIYPRSRFLGLARTRYHVLFAHDRFDRMLPTVLSINERGCDEGHKFVVNSIFS